MMIIISNWKIAQSTLATQFVSKNIYLKRGRTLDLRLRKMKAYIEGPATIYARMNKFSMTNNTNVRFLTFIIIRASSQFSVD